MEAEYHGNAALVVDDREIPVEVQLSGHVQPIDGKYRWAGRIHRNEDVRDLTGGRARTVTLRTNEGHEADATLGDEDPWGGRRVSGTGAPPFPVPTDPDHLSA